MPPSSPPTLQHYSCKPAVLLTYEDLTYRPGGGLYPPSGDTDQRCYSSLSCHTAVHSGAESELSAFQTLTCVLGCGLA